MKFAYLFFSTERGQNKFLIFMILRNATIMSAANKHSSKERGLAPDPAGGGHMGGSTSVTNWEIRSIASKCSLAAIL